MVPLLSTLLFFVLSLGGSICRYPMVPLLPFLPSIGWILHWCQLGGGGEGRGGGTGEGGGLPDYHLLEISLRLLASGST